MDLLTTQAIQSIIAEWCGRKPEFKAHIERYCMALYHRGYSSPTISECLRQGFERSDLLGALDEQLACWEGRVIKAESKLVEENVEKRNESLKHKLYKKKYAELAICALREKVKSSECNHEQLKNKDQSLKLQLGKYFNEILEKADPDLYAWHRESTFIRSAAAQSSRLVNPSDSISVGLGLCASGSGGSADLFGEASHHQGCTELSASSAESKKRNASLWITCEEKSAQQIRQTLEQGERKPHLVELMRTANSSKGDCIVLATFGSEDDRDFVFHSVVYVAGNKLQMIKTDREEYVAILKAVGLGIIDPPAPSVFPASTAGKESSDVSSDDALMDDNGDVLFNPECFSVEMQFDGPLGKAPFDQQISGSGTSSLPQEMLFESDGTLIEPDISGISASFGEVAPVISRFCLTCGITNPSHVCNGQGDKVCEIEAAFCSACQGKERFTSCRIVCQSQESVSWKGKTCHYCQKCREPQKDLVICSACGSRHCEYCSAQWDSKAKKASQCTNCVHQREFMQGRCKEAHALHQTVEKILPLNHVTKTQQKLLNLFLKMAVMMNYLLQHSLMLSFGPTILKVLEYQQKKVFTSEITGSEAMRLHVPAEFYNRILNAALIQDEKDSRVAILTKPLEVIQSLQMKPIVIVYLHDSGHHPLMYLIVPTLLRMLRNDVVDIHIIILHCQIRLNVQPPFVKELVEEYLKAKRWHEFPPKKIQQVRDFVLKLQATVFLDLVGNQHGRRNDFPSLDLAEVVVNYLNAPSWLGKGRWSASIFDKVMSAKLLEHERREQALLVSCWQPALPDWLLDLVVRDTRDQRGVLRMHVNLALDRVGETLDWTWVILRRLPFARVYFQSFPICNIKGILDSAAQFEEKYKLSSRELRDRINFLPRMPMPEFIVHLRRSKMDVSISGGPYPANTGQQVTMAAGIPSVVAASDTLASHASQGLNIMAGLGGMNAKCWSDAVEKVVYLDLHPEILNAIEGHLDRLAMKRESIFDQERASLDLESIAKSVSCVTKESEHISCLPSRPFLVQTRGEEGKLQISVAPPDSDPIFPQTVQEHGEPSYGPLEELKLYQDIGGAKHILEHDERHGRHRRRRLADNAENPNHGDPEHSLGGEDAGGGGLSETAPPPPAPGSVAASGVSAGLGGTDGVFLPPIRGVQNYAWNELAMKNPSYDHPAATAGIWSSVDKDNMGGALQVEDLDSSIDLVSDDEVANGDGGGGVTKPGGGEVSADGGGGRRGSSRDGGGSGGGAECTLLHCNCCVLGSDCGSKPINCEGLDSVKPIDPRDFHGIPGPGEVRVVPTEINQALLQQMTLVLKEIMDQGAVATALDALIKEHGFAVVRAETLRSLIPNFDQMFEDASKELCDLLSLGNGRFEGKAFQNLSKTNMDADVGGGSRTLGKLNEDGACCLLLKAISGALTNESHRLLRSVEGVLQISGIHCQKRSEYASAHDDPQIAHVDHVANPMPHGRPYDNVSEANLKCFADPRVPVRSLLCNMEHGEGINLAIYPGSHDLARHCELLYTRHYFQLQQEALKRGITEAKFQPIWTRIQDTLLKARFPERMPAQSTTVPTRCGDLIVLAGNQVHYGLGHAGLRLFGSTVLDEYSDPLQNGFIHVHSSICIVDQSSVYAGMRGLCLPDSVAVPWEKMLAHFTKQLVAAWSTIKTVETRVRNDLFKKLLHSVLKMLDTDKLSRSRPDASQTALKIGNVLGLKLNERCNERRPLFLLVEHRLSDEKGVGVDRYMLNSAAIRNAMFIPRITDRTRRKEYVADSHGAWLQHAGRGCVLDNYTICFSVMEFEGEPLERILFESWDDRRVLTEENRLGFQALFRGLEDLWEVGFRFCYFHSDMLVFVDGKIKLVMAGYGYLGQSEATMSNGGVGTPKSMILGGRRSSSYHVGCKNLPASVDGAYVRRRGKLMADMEEDGQDSEGDGELSDGDGEPSDGPVDGSGGRMLTRHQLNNAFDKLKHTTKGLPHQPLEETFADTALWNEVFVDGLDTLDHRMVRESDFHQLILWIAFRLQFKRSPALSQADFTKACRTLLDTDPSDEKAIQFVREHCIADGVRAGSTRFGRAKTISEQPGATSRLAQLVGLSLLQQTRAAVLDELSFMPFAALPIFPPEHEKMLAGGGITVKVARFPIRDDGEFRNKALLAIKNAGLTAPDYDRTMLLINEGDKGVGLKLVDDWKPNDFSGFYIGFAGEGHSRFVVSTPGHNEVGEQCDAAPCKDLPLTWFIETGVPCPFFNGVSNETDANIKLFRTHSFKHVINKKEIICIPMGFKVFTRAGSYAAWKYTYDAGRGRSLKF